MGYRVLALDPDPHCPAAQVADGVIPGALTDPAPALELARRAEVITLETEHVPVEILEKVEAHRPLRPSSEVLRIIQDRLEQKRFLARLGLPQAPFHPVSAPLDFAAAGQVVGFPAILKTRRSGYDGKGQARVDRPEDLASAWDRIDKAPAVLEARIPFVTEVSVILARGVGGEIRLYPMAENVHRRHVLHTSTMPARVPGATARRGREMTVALAQALDLIGVMAVEMFLLPDGSLLVNEVAPRTHNSGHVTFGACATSQFEQQARAVCGLPLGEPSLFRPVVMLNLMGDLWIRGTPRWSEVLKHPGSRLHLYGKAEARPGRKMGHVLILDDDVDEALAFAEAVVEKLPVPA